MLKHHGLRFLVSGLAVLALGVTCAVAFAQATNDHADHQAAAPEHPMPEPVAHPLFDKFKTLVGTWEGTMEMGEGGDAMPYTSVYHLTAGGSALVETIMPGTPMEMVSVYFLDGDTLKMTHYCLAQNQPTLIASPGEKDNVIDLKFDSATNMPDPNAMHMRNATYEWIDADHIKIYGEGWLNGAPMEESCGVTELHRVPAE